MEKGIGAHDIVEVNIRVPLPSVEVSLPLVGVTPVSPSLLVGKKF